jgi:hypothetical protein
LAINLASSSETFRAALVEADVIPVLISLIVAKQGVPQAMQHRAALLLAILGRDPDVQALITQTALEPPSVSFETVDAADRDVHGTQETTQDGNAEGVSGMVESPRGDGYDSSGRATREEVSPDPCGSGVGVTGEEMGSCVAGSREEWLRGSRSDSQAAGEDVDVA